MRTTDDRGFSLPELLTSVAVLSLVIGLVGQIFVQMTNVHRTVWNRTQMQSGVRGAIELLQQEVGQAGLVTLPAPVSLTGATAIGAQTVGVTSTAGMFVGERLLIGTGATQETVTLTAVNAVANQVGATFGQAHAAGARVAATGGFASGIVPPDMANGSSGTVLKLYGDVHDNGQMVYVEYTCDLANGRLYRNSVPWDAAVKPALTTELILLGNVVANPNGTPCFLYQTAVVAPETYVIGVAITLSVQTQEVDPITRQFHVETKTLLNVSPRNVFYTWQLASMLETNRIQPMPATILNLLP